MPQHSSPSTSTRAAPGPTPGSRRGAGAFAGGTLPPGAMRPPPSMPLGQVMLWGSLVSMVMAALVGYAVAWAVQPASPWAVALAAALGVLCTVLPLGAAGIALARRADSPSSQEADTVPAPIPAPAGLHGLALSREAFMDVIGREWARSRRYGTGAALLLVEVDRHARLCEVLGEAAGDQVLDALLSHIASTLRGADALARFECGQIVVFLAHADATGALDVAERIRERAEHLEVPVPPKRVRFTVSVGVAHLRPAHLHLQALVDDVAEAAAAARAVGGNCVRAAPVEVGSRPAPGAARDGHRTPKG